MSVAMLSLSLGWSIGALACGQIVHWLGKKASTILGSLFLTVGGAIMLTFTTATSLSACSVVLGFIGLGMGFVSMATLLVVQDSLDIKDLGVATASHQFSRTLGGTIGVGISGSFVTLALSGLMASFTNGDLNNLPPTLKVQISQSIENIFRPEVQALLPADVLTAMQDAVAHGIVIVFWITLVASLLCLFLSIILPTPRTKSSKES